MLDEAHVPVRVWDLPVRVVHWALVLLLAFQVVTGYVGGELMPWHAASGYAILALVAFRIAWGFLGGTHARFADFVRGPAAAMRFAARLFSRRPSPYIGHNPLGGWSVLAMLASLAVQGLTGLFANDGLAFEGPLAKLISLDLSNRLAHVHRGNVNLVLALSALHVAAVLFHRFVKKERLMGAMFTGVKEVPAGLLAREPAARTNRVQN